MSEPNGADLKEKAYSEERAKWELEKLKAEVRHLSRPWLRTPASWVAVATTLIALAGASFQWYRSDIDYKLADIKKERAAFETEKLERLRTQYSEEIRRTQTKLNDLLKRTSIASGELNKAENRLKALGRQLPSTPANRAAVKQAEDSLSSVREANAEVSAQTKRTSNTLTGLLELLRRPQSLQAEVEVRVVDPSSGRDVNGLEIVAAPVSHLSSTLVFPELSSPATARLYRGLYYVWARGKVGEQTLEGEKVKVDLISSDRVKVVVSAPPRPQGSAPSNIALTIEGEPGEEIQIWYRGDRETGEAPIVYTGTLGPDGRVTVSVPRAYLLLGRPVRRGGKVLGLHNETGAQITVPMPKE
jgi:hypothetical protein